VCGVLFLASKKDGIHDLLFLERQRLALRFFQKISKFELYDTNG